MELESNKINYIRALYKSLNYWKYTCIGGVTLSSLNLISDKYDHISQCLHNGNLNLFSLGDYGKNIGDSFLLSSAFFALDIALNIKSEFDFSKRKDLITDIFDSEKANELIELYNQYVNLLGEFISKHSCDGSALASSILYTKMLDNGYISFSGSSDKYKSYKYDLYDHIENLWGARVLTGKSVCRHKASMLTDILNSQGFVASNMQCLPGTMDEVKNNFIYNHLITGFYDNGESALYDPTSDFCYMNKFQKISDTEFVANCINDFICYKLPIEQKDDKDFKYELNRRFNANKILTNINFENPISEKKNLRYLNILKESESVMSGDRNDFNNFYQKQIKLMGEIVKLYSEIIPYSDSRLSFKKNEIKVKLYVK